MKVSGTVVELEMNSFTMVIISSILRIHIRYSFNKLEVIVVFIPSSLSLSLYLSLSHPLCDDALQPIREEALREKMVFWHVVR